MWSSREGLHTFQLFYDKFLLHHSKLLALRMQLNNVAVMILLQQVHVVTQTRSRLKFKSNEDNPVRIK